MRLSTFSSDRIHSNTLKQSDLITAFVLGFALLIQYELLWRSGGAVTFPVDSKARWASEREEAVSQPDTLAVVGASRILFGFSGKTVEEFYPKSQFAQLAAASFGPLATIQDIANDEQFKGTLLVSFFPVIFLPPKQNEQQPYVDYYNYHWNENQKFNLSIATRFDNILVSRQQNFGIDNVLRNLANKHSLPEARLYLINDQDRGYFANYKLTDIKSHQERRTQTVTKQNEYVSKEASRTWPEMANKLHYALEKITNRGGCVVMVRLPISKKLLAIEEATFPKSEFWDPLIKKLGVHAIHYQQMEELQTLDFADYVHVSGVDKRFFTEVLLKHVKRVTADDPSCIFSRH